MFIVCGRNLATPVFALRSYEDKIQFITRQFMLADDGAKVKVKDPERQEYRTAKSLAHRERERERGGGEREREYLTTQG